MFVAPNDLFVIRAIAVIGGIVIPLTRFLFAALFEGYLFERFNLFPHLGKNSLGVLISTRVRVGIPGGSTMG